MTRFIAIFALAFASFSAAGKTITEADLLPVDTAYPLSIEAISRDSVEIRWGIADG